MNDHRNKRAKEILQKIIYATLATVTPDGKPWNSPVRHNYDDDLNIYWFSDKEGQHSKNVRDNGRVFIVIYDSTVPEGQGKGLYFEARAYELNDPEEIRYARRLKKGPDNDAPDDFMGEAVRRVYKAVPQRAWMNDAEIKDGKFIKDFRVRGATRFSEGLNKLPITGTGAFHLCAWSGIMRPRENSLSGPVFRPSVSSPADEAFSRRGS